MTKWADRAIEEAKKRKVSEPKHQTTAVSSPLRGANQDQSGHGVTHNVADYTISDETIHEIVAGVGSVRTTPVTMQSTPRGSKAANSPASAGRLQRAADIRRRKLDQVAQQQKDQQQQERQRQQEKRTLARQKRQHMNEEYEVVKHPTYGKVLSKGGKAVTTDYDTADSHAAKHKGASLIKSLHPKKYHVKMPEHMPVGPIKESTMIPFKFFKEAADSSPTSTTTPTAKLSHRTSGVSSNKDFNLSWAKAGQAMRDTQQKMTGSMSAINYNRNKPETGGNIPEPPKVTQAPAGAPDKASSGPSVPTPPSDNLSSIKKAVQTYTPEPIKTAIKSADKATGGALGDVGGSIVKSVSGAADLISKGASTAGKAIQSFGDKLSDLTGGIIKDPNRPKNEEKKMKTEEKISRFVDFISEEEKKKRGRPPKATTDTGEEAAEKRHSLVAQFRDRKPDASGHYSVDVDGSSHRVHTSHAQRFLSAHGAARTADQKDSVERKFKSELKSKK